MAMSVDEAKMMQKESELTSSVLMIGHCWRYDNEVTWMRKQIAEDRLGKIVKTKGCSSHVNWGPSGWFTQKQLSGGGALVDMGIHAIDTARFLLGDPQPASVFARIGTYYGKYDVDDTGIIIIGWKSGTTSYLEFGWWQPHSDGPEAATQLYGIKGFGSVFPSYIKETNSDQQNNEIPENGFKFPREDHAAQEMYDNQMRHFISCIINKADPISSSEIGITNMRILEAAYKSNEEGEIIRLS
jgi:predicted dehydrogenase